MLQGNIPRTSAGFTVLEVIIALAILSVSLGIIYEAGSSSLSNVGYARDASTATALAQSVLGQVGSEIPIRAGETQGSFGNALTWKLQQIVLADSAGTSAFWRYKEQLVIEWKDGQVRRSISLVTLRLAPAGSVQ